MTLKSAALFALVGMILLTVVVALGFIRDISAFTAGAIAAMALLISLSSTAIIKTRVWASFNQLAMRSPY
jgi:hypothetical protein